ncbi:hypothetical protein [Leclercia sp.]|uniref:hypothetical protein n=1 Tax=Leclercia sp. TaxID=1898428 RepID=UPI0028AA34E0|nr:hypothetical protein [Leclercia sp.]
MRTDIDYLRGLLAVFLDNEDAFITTQVLDDAGYDITSDKGIHHYHLLAEQGFISDYRLRREPQFVGLNYHMNGIDKVPHHNLRLTSEGMAFAQTLEEPTVYEKLKSFSDAPLDVIKDVGGDIFKALLKKKLGIE